MTSRQRSSAAEQEAVAVHADARMQVARVCVVYAESLSRAWPPQGPMTASHSLAQLQRSVCADCTPAPERLRPWAHSQSRWPHLGCIPDVLQLLVRSRLGNDLRTGISNDALGRLPGNHASCRRGQNRLPAGHAPAIRRARMTWCCCLRPFGQHAGQSLHRQMVCGSSKGTPGEQRTTRGD